MNDIDEAMTAKDLYVALLGLGICFPNIRYIDKPDQDPPYEIQLRTSDDDKKKWQWVRLFESDAIFIMCGMSARYLDGLDVGYTSSSGCGEFSVAYEYEGKLKVLQGFKTQHEALLACVKAVVEMRE